MISSESFRQLNKFPETLILSLSINSPPKTDYKMHGETLKLMNENFFLYNGMGSPANYGGSPLFYQKSSDDAKNLKHRKRVAIACVPCNRAKTSCDGNRPCKRCVSRQMMNQCENVVHKKKGRPKKKFGFDIKTGFRPVVSPNSMPSHRIMTSNDYDQNIFSPQNYSAQNIFDGAQSDNFDFLTQNDQKPQKVYATPNLSFVSITQSQNFCQNFRNKIRLIWYQIWQPNLMRSFISDNLVSTTVHFSVSLVRQALSEEEFGHFRAQLNRLFVEMGFTAPKVFKLFNFNFRVDTESALNVYHKLPLLVMRYRFVQISAEDLDVMLFINKMARNCLEQNEADIVESIKHAAAKDSMALPFLWRCFSPASWDFMIQVEQLACSMLKPEYGFHTKVTLLKSDGAELPCWASIRYNLSEDKIFDSVEFYLIPIDANGLKEKKAHASYDNEAELLSAFELGKILKIQ